jgi:hypothetical protein
LALYVVSPAYEHIMRSGAPRPRMCQYPTSTGSRAAALRLRNHRPRPAMPRQGLKR